MRNTTECQARLIKLGYLAPTYIESGIVKPSDDGKFGNMSLDAYNHYRASLGKPPATPPIHLDALNADLFPEEQPAPLPPKPSIFSNLSAFLSIYNLFSKGTPMTADQLTGVVRAILALVSGYFIAKGAGSADMWNWIIAGITGVIPFIWTWISNRPKTIVPMSQK